MRARRSSLIAILVATLVVVAAAPARASIVTVDQVPGQIYDVDATRILFKQSEGAFAIESRSTGDVTSIPLATDHHPIGGYLTSHGALMVASTGETFPGAEVDELRDGVGIVLGGIYGSNSLRVAGDFAEWSNDTALVRRDLATATNVTVATNALNAGNDVAANGDVAYGTTGDGINLYRGGVTTTLARESQTQPRTYPRTDGVNVVWRETSPFCCGGPSTSTLHAYGSGGAFALDDTPRNYFAEPGGDYRVAGGYIAYTRGDFGATEVWRHDPGGGDTKVADAGPNAIMGLAPDGSLIYATDEFDSTGFVLARPGEAATPVGLLPDAETPAATDIGYGDRFVPVGDRWYLIVGGSLRRVAPGARADGGATHIVSGPNGDDAGPSHATFSFASDTPGAGFECKLDGGDFLPCSSNPTFDSLRAGEHSLAVRSVDGAGNVDPDPATATWQVERDPPDVTLDQGPSGRVRDRTPTLGGGAGTDAEDANQVTLNVYAPGATPAGTPVRTIVVDRAGGAWTATVDPPLPDGQYRAVAEQTDAAGNVGRSAPRTFTVDGTPPETALEVSPRPVLTGHTVLFDASGSSDPGGGTIVRYQWDLDGDGDFERDTGADSTTTKTYADAGRIHPAVRETDAVGNHAVERIDVTVAPDPPPGLVGVTIDDGAQFTNDPDVYVSPVWPPGATEIILSNDGGFGDATRVPLSRAVPWRLDSSGPERLPKTVYVRFSPNGTTYQDDIILDETAPAITRAEFVDDRHAVVEGRDRTSGIAKMEITRHRSHPGHPRRYRRRVKVRAGDAPVYVRLRDRARNWSRWKRIQP